MIHYFDGTKTDEDIVKDLMQKEKEQKISVTVTDGNTLENVLNDFVSGLRHLIENNFFHMEI